MVPESGTISMDGVAVIDDNREQYRETTSLSSGQRKRLALPECIPGGSSRLLFDEWASDQDSMFRRFFYTEIFRDLAARGKAVVCVTHDDKYFSLAHERLKLDAGQVVGEEETSEFIARMSRS